MARSNVTTYKRGPKRLKKPKKPTKSWAERKAAIGSGMQKLAKYAPKSLTEKKDNTSQEMYRHAQSGRYDGLDLADNTESTLRRFSDALKNRGGE